MKFIVFYLEFINSLEGPGMFFSSAAIICRLRSYAATPLVGSYRIYAKTMVKNATLWQEKEILA